MQLRSYQQEAVDTVLDRFFLGGITRPVIVMATGGGKTITAASLVHAFVESGERFLFLAHRDKLLEQAHTAFLNFFSLDDLGIVQGPHDQPGRRGVFASWDTLRQPRRLTRYLSYGK